MALAKNEPNTILLHGRDRAIIIDKWPLIDTGAKPGHFVEKFSSSGTLAWRKVTSPTDMQSKFILLENDLNNSTLDTAYTSGDFPPVACLDVGMVVWPLVASGQDITAGDYCQQAGDGTIKEATATTAAANVAHYQALETLGVVTELTRLRLEVVQ
jgi:hypothetical protein